ncbi:MAG: DUF502 domain-containing protein [Myxococcota bacterium]
MSEPGLYERGRLAFMKRVVEFLPVAWQRLRAAFFAGLLLLVPAGVTVAILSFLIGRVDALQPSRFFGREIPGLGIAITGALVLIAGFATQNWLGRRIVGLGEDLLARVPLLNSVYGGVKQVVEAALSRGGDTVQAVVLVEWPRRGVYSIGFYTGQSFAQPADPEAPRLLNIFLPSTPNPTTGFYFMAPEDEVVFTELTVEEAAKLLMSAGIVGGEEEPLITLPNVTRRGGSVPDLAAEQD